MSENIIYRHNIINIDSIETFLSVKGGFNKGQRDVYFVRMVGTMSGINDKIVDIDRRMDIETMNKRLFYTRVKQLPRLKKPDDMQFYSEQFEKWKAEGKVSVRNNSEIMFAKTLGSALNTILSEYRQIKPISTETMEKNLAVKMLFWTDSVLGDSLCDWNEKKCIKVIAENVVKEQDYLFYYMLTLLGCDVLLMQCCGDIEILPELKNKSLNMKSGSFEGIELPEYVRYKGERKTINKDEQTTVHSETAVMKPVDITHPKRAKAKREVIIPARSVVNTNAGKPKESAEKSFEDLALMASSVVMITVFNRRGEPEATGSGIMIGRDGYILTNNHVVAGGCFYTVRIEDDDNAYEADGVIKTNSVLDMAVIRINKKLKPIPIYNGKQKLVRGQKVVAIGSPLGLFNSVSNGIISGFRKINDVDMIQFTAPISHGSSGGAVLNMQGQIIGISTAGIDEGQNINLAVSYENILLFANGFY